MTKQILSKSEYYRLANVLGNQPRTFGNLGEVNPSTLPDIPLALRSVERVGGVFLPLTKGEVPNTNPYPYEVRINETFPNEWVLYQGEVARMPDWHLAYSTERKFYRDAMQSRKVLEGYAARLFMEGIMGPYFDRILTLQDMYPDATIEWGYYSRPVGTWNEPLVLWEVRNY
jgi:hypothetical protein